MNVCALYIPKYECFYQDTHVSVTAENVCVKEQPFRRVHSFSLLCRLFGDPRGRCSFLSSCWELGTSVPRRASGFVSLSPASEIPPHCSWSSGTNLRGLCGTVIPWCWESLKFLKYCQRFPRGCSESKALTHVNESLQDRDLSVLALAVLTQQTTSSRLGQTPPRYNPPNLKSCQGRIWLGITAVIIWFTPAAAQLRFSRALGAAPQTRNEDTALHLSSY